MAHITANSGRIEYNPINVPGLTLQLDLQGLKSINSSQEWNSGADVYVSIVRTDGGKRRSKGMLIQAKREKSLARRDERERLAEQCRKMRRRTHDAYVWLFNEDGVKSTRARKHATAPSPKGSLNQWVESPGMLWQTH